MDIENPLSPPSQPSPLKGEGGSGLLTLSQKETSPEGEGFPPSPKGTLSRLSKAADVKVVCCTVKLYPLNFELARRFRLTPASAAWIASFR